MMSDATTEWLSSSSWFWIAYFQSTEKSTFLAKKIDTNTQQVLKTHFSNTFLYNSFLSPKEGMFHNPPQVANFPKYQIHSEPSVQKWTESVY